ncbi:MAG: hypothetical protein KAS04_01240 [Candidatus Aenigmarchaeota archaeon]|nr:hypothetical protein [Candidatus Aenigmarchaeota archaeon]
MTQQIVKKKTLKKNTVKKTVPLLSKKKPKNKGGRPKGKVVICGRCKKPKKDCKCGRPLFDGKDEKSVLSKLEHSFSIGCTDEEACVYADISVPALQRYCTANSKFRERKELLKNKPVLMARKEVVEGIGGDKEFAFKFLERKRKSEFAPQFNGILDDGKGEGILTREREAEIAAAMGNWSEDDDDND